MQCFSDWTCFELFIYYMSPQNCKELNNLFGKIFLLNKIKIQVMFQVKRLQNTNNMEHDSICNLL